MKTINCIGVAVIVTAVVLSWAWFGWKLPLVVFLFIVGNNMERAGINRRDK